MSNEERNLKIERIIENLKKIFESQAFEASARSASN